MNDAKPVRRGDSLIEMMRRGDLRTLINATSEMWGWYLRQKDQLESSLDDLYPHPGVVQVANKTGLALDRFSVLQLQGALFDPTAGMPARLSFQQAPNFVGVIPSSPPDGNRWVVTLDPIPAQGSFAQPLFGRAVLAGAVAVQVDILNLAHGFCAPVAFATGYLVSAATGPGVLLSTPNKLGLQWCQVAVGRCCTPVLLQAAGSLAGSPGNYYVTVACCPNPIPYQLCVTIDASAVMPCMDGQQFTITYSAIPFVNPGNGNTIPGFWGGAWYVSGCGLGIAGSDGEFLQDNGPGWFFLWCDPVLKQWWFGLNCGPNASVPFQTTMCYYDPLPSQITCSPFSGTADAGGTFDCPGWADGGINFTIAAACSSSGAGSGTVPARVSLGRATANSASNGANATASLTGLNVPAGAMLVVQVGLGDAGEGTQAVLSATFAGQALTLDASATHSPASSLSCSVYVYHLVLTSAVTGGTLTITAGSSDDAIGVIVSAEYVTGLTLDAYQAGATATGTGTSPLTTGSITTTEAEEYVEAAFVIVTSGLSEGPSGGWGGGFADGTQTGNVSVSGSTFALVEGWQIVGSPATVTPTYTAVNVQWAGAQVAYQ